MVSKPETDDTRFSRMTDPHLRLKASQNSKSKLVACTLPNVVVTGWSYDAVPAIRFCCEIPL